MSAAGPGLATLSVLIVEDNHDGADSLALVLRQYGHQVRVAYTGPAGVREALDDPPDAVLCDINLPGQSGLSVARRLADGLPEKPLLIAITACPSDELADRALRSGFDHYFIKPVDPAELAALLAEHAEGCGR
jgi:DNA-binding response OmpR family regulator